MKDKRIGNIILHGGTIEDLQKEFPNFPSENIVEYLISLGYASSTSKRYGLRLTVNSNYDDSVKSAKRTSPVEKNFLYSGNPNSQNILVDSCALVHPECLEIIDKAQKVTFTTATIEELDRKAHIKSSNNSSLSSLNYNARKYMAKILEDDEKYMVAQYSKSTSSQYVDTILLEYLSILPKQIRPTLLTADRDLAIRAKAHDFEYIYYISNQPKVQTDNSNSTSLKDCLKHFGFGIRLYNCNNSDSLYICSTCTHPIKLIRNNKVIGKYTINSTFKVNIGDIIHVYFKYKDNIQVKEFQVEYS